MLFDRIDAAASDDGWSDWPWSRPSCSAWMRSASAQESKPRHRRPDDPAARALLEQVAKAYRSLSSYSDQGQFVVAMTLGGKAQKQVRPLKLAFVRPNKLDLDAGAGRAHQRRQDDDHRHRAAEEVHDGARPRIDRHRHLPRGAHRRDPLRRTDRRVADVRAAEPADRGRIPTCCSTRWAARSSRSLGRSAASPTAPALLIDLQEGPDLLLQRRSVDEAPLRHRAEDRPRATGQECPARPDARRSSSSAGRPGTVSTQLATDRSFAFVRPEGVHPDRSAEGPARRRAQAPKYAIQEKIGKPAPDFTLTLLDGPGQDPDRLQGRPGRQGRPDRLLGDLVRALPDGAARDPEAHRALAKSKKDVVDRRAEPGHRPGGDLGGPQAGREDPGRQEDYS